MTQLGVVQAAGDFLAVAGDEGHGRAFIEQRHGGGDLLRAHAQFFGDAVVDAEHKTLSTLERKTDHVERGQTIERRIINTPRQCAGNRSGKNLLTMAAPVIAAAGP
ncbi:hypothetical protein D3C86_1456970 [compost metagenome]